MRGERDRLIGLGQSRPLQFFESHLSIVLCGRYCGSSRVPREVEWHGGSLRLVYGADEIDALPFAFFTEKTKGKNSHF